MGLVAGHTTATPMFMCAVIKHDYTIKQQVSINPPVEVIVVVLCLSPEVEKHQR